MKVFIAGATGVLGRRLAQQFRTRGDRVVGLARSDQGEQTVRALGGEPRRADLFDADSLARAAEGADVVIHAATSIPTKPKTTPQDWAMNDRIRLEGTHALTECAARIGAAHYVQQSIVWVARPADGSAFDEDTPAKPVENYRTALDAEEIAREAGARSGFSVAVLRGGWFYSGDAAHTRLFADRLRQHSLPIIGDGSAVWAWIHTDDAASAFVAAAAAKRSGVWHVVDDELVPAGVLLSYFAERLGALAPRHVPAWLARLFVGQYGVSFMTSSTRTTNARLRRDLGWAPRFPTYREGIDQIVATWRTEPPAVRAATAR